MICFNCHVHNGMALSEEFEHVSFFCYKCAHYNPSRSEIKAKRTHEQQYFDQMSFIEQAERSDIIGTDANGMPFCKSICRPAINTHTIPDRDVPLLSYGVDTEHLNEGGHGRNDVDSGKFN